MKISDVLAGKASQDVVTISPDASVRELLALLSRHNIGAVVVSGDGAAVDGIVSERDVVRCLHGDDSCLDHTVGQIMTGTVHSVQPADSLDDVRRLMTEQRFRHVPVVDGGRLTGIVSIGDIVKAYIDKVEFERDQLDSYVHSSQT
jgi:CBS domain-containing protein